MNNYFRQYVAQYGFEMHTLSSRGGYTWDTALSLVEARLDEGPQLIFELHTEQWGTLARRDFVERTFRPMETMLAARGCSIKIATLIREAKALARSEIFYNRVPRDKLENHLRKRGNFLSQFLFKSAPGAHCNGGFHAESCAAGARRLLGAFDLVGRSEELPSFIDALRRLLNWPASEVLTAHTINPTPGALKWDFNASENDLLSRYTSEDKLLYSSFLCSKALGLGAESMCRQRAAEPALHARLDFESGFDS